MPSVKQLQYFCALAEEKNMSRLASKLYISQTALSNSLARLESELGYTLFLRSPGGLTINKSGVLYLEYAKKMLDLLGEAQEKLKQLNEKEANQLSVAFNSPLLYSSLLTEFMSEYPNCVITQSMCDIDQIEAGLPSLSVDVLLAGTEDFTSGWLEEKVVTEDTIYICVPFGHPFSERGSVRLEDCVDEPFIFQPMSSGFSRFSMELFREAGYTPKIVAYCESSLRKELFATGKGILLASDAVRRVNYYGKCAYIPIEPKTTRKMSVFWSKRKPLSAMTQAFIEFSGDHFKKQAAC